MNLIIQLFSELPIWIRISLTFLISLLLTTLLCYLATKLGNILNGRKKTIIRRDVEIKTPPHLPPRPSKDYPGVFIVLEGIDGSGKTTAANYIFETLKIMLGVEREVVKTREPGGSSAAEEIRKLFLGRYFDKLTELLLVNAARSDHIYTTILPALKSGSVVVCDRFVDTTYAYQGYVNEELHRTLRNEVVGKNLNIDFIFYFNATLDTVAKRILSRGQDNRFDSVENLKEIQARKERLEFSVRNRHSNVQIIEIDANKPIEQVQLQIMESLLNKVVPVILGRGKNHAGTQND